MTSEVMSIHVIHHQIWSNVYLFFLKLKLIVLLIVKLLCEDWYENVNNFSVHPHDFFFPLHTHTEKELGCLNIFNINKILICIWSLFISRESTFCITSWYLMKRNIYSFTCLAKELGYQGWLLRYNTFTYRIHYFGVIYLRVIL